MQLHEIKLHGIGHPFRESTVDLHFDEIPEGLVAIVGKNGAGKTHVLEAVMAALEREFPSYGESVAAHVSPGVKDAFVEATFSLNGDRYRVLTQADPLYGGGRGVTEQYVFKNGTAIAGPKVKDAEAALSKILPPKELLLASIFAAQGGGGSFFRMVKGDRKALFIEMLGLDHLELLSKAAGERAAELHLRYTSILAAKKPLEEAVSRAKELEAKAKELRSTVAPAKARVDRAAMILAGAETELEKARERKARAEEQNRSLEADRRRLRDEASAALTRGKTAGEKREAAEKKLREVEGAKGAGAELSQKRVTLEAAVRDVEARQAALAEATTLSARLQKSLSDARSLYETTKSRGERQVLEARMKREGLEKSQRSIENRIARLNAQKPDGLCDACPLAGDLHAAEEELAGVVQAISEIPDPADLQAKLNEELRPLVDDGKEVKRDLQKAEADVPSLREVLSKANLLLGEIRRDVTALERRADLEVQAERLDTERKAAAEAQEEALAVYRKAEREMAALPKPADLDAFLEEVVKATTAHQEAARAKAHAEEELRKISEAIARLEGELQAVAGAKEKLEEAEAELERLVTEVADWGLLSKSLGKDGVQALEIAAAGPGVTTIANDLLASCYGPRFSLSIETTALKKDGGQKEVFDIRIIDSDAGREATKVSGGELVVLDEALRLSLAIYNQQRSGFELRTLFRDETAGALDPDNADRYVKMLRRAREIGGFRHVIFIAHATDVWAQADTHLLVEDGAVRAI